MKDVLMIEALREGYRLDQIENTMTVGELKELLSDYDDDMPIYLSHDNGYTYGGITERRIRSGFENKDGGYEEY